MSTNTAATSAENADVPTYWVEEIIRETEHYYQGEMQHDQRASWLLATSSVTLAGLFAFLPQMETAQSSPIVPLAVTLALLLLTASGLCSIISFLPMRKNHFELDVLGSEYRATKARSVEIVLQNRFRFDRNYSKESYMLRLGHHYRNHYLRALYKARFVMWSSIFLGIGLCLVVTAMLVMHFA